MLALTRDHIKKQVADSNIIFQRGVRLHEYGAYSCIDARPAEGVFDYDVDGNYGDYTVRIRITGDSFDHSCDCPYPGDGCKHTVAVINV